MFRFENLEVWKRSATVSLTLFEIADRLSDDKRYRWAEQLRAAVLSITNNIAEGSGSASPIEFAQFLNIARRSLFETVNILLILRREKALPEDGSDLINELSEISRMITALRKTLI